MACDPNTLLVSGAAFQALSERDQMICIAELICEASLGGGMAGNYNGGEPTFTPTHEGVSAIDKDTGRVWWYYNAQWN